MTELTTKCIRCRFWSPDKVDPPVDLENEDWMGRCHRHAPTPSASTDLIDEQPMWWPMTAHYDWCGEFKRHDAAPAPAAMRQRNIGKVLADRLIDHLARAGWPFRD